METRAQYADRPARLGYIARLGELKGTLDRANSLLRDIVGPPLDGQNDIAKEPDSVMERLSAEIWDAQAMATTVVQQLERLHEDLT